MRICLALLSVAFLTGCQDETLQSYGGAGGWRLTEMSGEPYDGMAVLRLERRGAVSGNGPCNAFSARQTAPYPWFELGPVASTKRACPGLDDEGAFLAALSRMTQSEVLGDVLILSNQARETMVFSRLPPDG